MINKERYLVTNERIRDFLSPKCFTSYLPNEETMERFVSQLNEKELDCIINWLRNAAFSYRKSYDKFEVIESVLGTGGVTTLAVSAVSLAPLLVVFPFLYTFLGVGLFYANDYKNKRQILYNLKLKKGIVDNQIIKNLMKGGKK